MEEQLLKEYVGTYLNPKYNGDWDIVNSKFPELSGVDKEILKEYVGTYLNPKYNGDWNVVNSKFPELFPARKSSAERPAEQVKKKEDTVSPFVDGGSGLTNFDPRTGKVVQETPAFAQKQPEVKVPEQKMPARTEFQYQPGKPLPEQKPAPLPKFVEEQLSAVTPELIGKIEENVVPQLKYQFGPLGFKFEETGAGDYMIATSPSGESIEISLDITDNDARKSEANKLNAFLRKGTTAVKNLSTIQKQYVDANKKILSQKELDESLASINAEETKILARNAEFVKTQNKLEAEKAQLESVPVQQRNNPEYIARVNDFISRADQFSGEFQSFIKDSQDLSKRGQQLNRSIGKYTEMKAQQGTWYGAALNAFANKSYYEMAKGLSGVAVDFIGEVISATGLPIMSPENYEKTFIEQAKKEGINVTEGEDFISLANKLDPETLAKIENRVIDAGKKSVKGEIIGGLDKTSKMAMESTGVSPEYYKSVEETFVGGALLGALTSIPAMAGGPVTRTILMGSQVLSGLDAEMANDPEFEDISENEKYLVKGPIAVAVAALESAGLSNLLNQKGFLNGLVLKALGKVGKGASYKTFGEVIKNEIDSAAARGALTLGAGFLAEAETGALQEVADITAKEIYNMAKEKEMFDTPDSVVQFIEQVGKAGLQEGIGAGVLAVPGSVSAAYTGKGFLGMDDAQFAMFEKMANDSNIQKGFVARLKSRINNGEITAAEGKDILNNYRNSVGLFNSLPDNLDMKGKKEAMNLLKEKRDLERQIEGKDQALTVPQRNRVNEINQQLTKLSEDAIQEQAAGQVPVQPETRDRQEMAQGEPQAEPKVVTQEGQVQEVVDPLKDVESTTNALANALIDSTGIINDRDSFNTIYDIVREGDLFSDVREKARKEGGGIPQRAIAEKYHESKANGTNPDFVQLVENAFIQQTPAQQPEIDIIEAQRRQELEANKAGLDKPYYLGETDGPTLGEVINKEYDDKINELKSRTAPAVSPAISPAISPEQIQKQSADLNMEVKALEDLLDEQEPLFKKSDNDTKFGESADAVADVVRQINELPSGNVTTTITPKPQKPIDIADLESRADTPVKRTTFDVIKGIPAVFSISDQLRIGNVTNPNTGNVIDRLFGGLGFGFTKGHEGFAWANTTKDEAQNLVNRAVSVYNNNKALFDDWWAKNPEYNGLVPLNIAKMAEGSIMSNEALYRVIKDNFASFPKKNKVDALNYLTKNRIPSIIESLNNSLRNPNLAKNARKSVEKRIKSLNSIQGKIKDGKLKSIDQLLDPEFYTSLSLPVRAELISQLTIGSPNKPGEQKASGLPGKNTVPRALLGIDQEASVSAKSIGEANLNKVSLSNAVETITEPAMRDIDPRQIIAIYGIDVLNPSVKETVHPNYKFGVNGRPIGVLENSVSIQEAYPFAYTNILESLIAQEEKAAGELKAAPIESLINEKIPVGIGLPNLEFIGAISDGVMSNAQKLSAWLNKSFPSVIMSTDAETFANILKSDGVRVQLKGDEVVYGVTVDGDIYINPDVHNTESALFNTTIHEFGHVWLNFLDTTPEGKRLLNRGTELVKKTDEYKEQLKKFNGDKSKAANEALAILIGNRGETITDASTKSKFEEFLLAVWKYVKDKFKLSSELTIEEVQNLTLDQFLGTAIADLFSGKPLATGEIQLKKLKNPEAAFSKSDSIDSIVQKGRANGFSEESIKIVLQKRGFTQEAIDTALGKQTPAAKKVEVTEEFAPGYDRMIGELEGVVEKSLKRGTSQEKAMENAINYLQGTKVYENATDVQREQMVRDVRKRFKKREKAAPSAEKVVGKPKKKEVTVDEMAALKDQIKLEARAAREAKGDLNNKRKALAAKIIAARKKGVITAVQARALVNRISRVNLDNPIMVDRLLEYTDKVFDDANYAADMAELRKLQRQAKSRNHTSMTNVVKQFTSINPENIPLDRIQDYKEALDFLNNRTPFYGNMNDIFDEMLSYQISEEFDAIKTIEALNNKYKDIMSNKVKTVEDYVNLIKDINSFKRKAYQLLQNESITQEEYDNRIKMVGENQQTIEENYKNEITKIKKDLIAEIKNQRPKVSRDFSSVENDLIRKYLELSDADLESLSPEDLFVLNDLLENISNGEIDNFRFNEIISKAYTSDGANRLAKQIDDSKFDMTPEEGTKELSEYESSFWEGLLGMGRAKSGALQKFVVSVFNRAISSYENLTRDGYNEFLKLKKKYKMSDKDMHKIGMLTTYLQEYMAQFDPKNDGIKDIGSRDWFKEILNSKSMRGKYSSGKPSVLKVIGLGKSEIDIIEEIWDSLPKDKDGNVNPKAVYDSYMANDGKFFTKNEKGFFDDVMAYKTSEITPKQKFANEINGALFKEIPFHMMRVRLDGGKNQITPTASSDNGVVRIKAGTGKERVSEAVGPIMTNFEKLFITNLEQTGRDYFLSGALKDINNTLSGAKKKIDSDKMPLLDTISVTLSEALGYEFDRTRTEMILRSLLSARAATTLLNPIRTAIELGATLASYPLRAKTLSGYKELFGKQKEMSKLLEFTNSPLRLRQNINNAIDINDGRIEPQSRLTKATAYLSGLPERTMMVTSWMPTFKSEFKDITGLDFDMKKFNDSEAYREKYGKAVKEASAVADAQTEKIIGPTTKAGQRREVRIAPKVLANIIGLEGTVSKNTAAGQILGFFSNYPYREVTEFVNGFREAAEVIKDEGALTSLSQLQKPLGIALNVAAYGFLGSLAYAAQNILLGDEDDEERGNKILKDLLTTEGFLNELASNAISLAGSKYAAGGKALLQLAATIAIESTDDEEQKAKIKKLLKDSVFVDPLPVEQAAKFGGRDKALSAIGMYIPQFVILADRYADLIGSLNEVEAIYDKVETKGIESLTQDEGQKVLALNTLFNASQIVLNLAGTSIPAYNYIKTYMNKLKEDAGVAEVYKGEAPTKKKSSGGSSRGGGINKTDLKKYYPEQYNELYGKGSPGYEVEQEIKAFEKEQREFKKKMKEQLYGGD